MFPRSESFGALKSENLPAGVASEATAADALRFRLFLSLPIVKLERVDGEMGNCGADVVVVVGSGSKFPARYFHRWSPAHTVNLSGPPFIILCGGLIFKLLSSSCRSHVIKRGLK